MKQGIHPQYNMTTVTCSSCGTKYTLGSTQENIHVELCSNCHPFYTGQQKFVDTASRIKSFEDRMRKMKDFQVKVTAKKEERERKANAPKTLAEMLAAAK